jgi:hypothetical protein
LPLPLLLKSHSVFSSFFPFSSFDNQAGCTGPNPSRGCLVVKGISQPDVTYVVFKNSKKLCAPVDAACVKREGARLLRKAGGSGDGAGAATGNDSNVNGNNGDNGNSVSGATTRPSGPASILPPPRVVTSYTPPPPPMHGVACASTVNKYGGHCTVS